MKILLIYFSQHSQWISKNCEFISVLVNLQLCWCTVYPDVPTSSGMTSYYFEKSLNLKLTFLTVCIKTFNRNIPSVRYWFIDSSVFVPFLLLWRNGDRSIACDCWFSMGFTLVSISNQIAKIHETDHWIFTYSIPLFWSWTHVLYNG